MSPSRRHRPALFWLLTLGLATAGSAFAGYEGSRPPGGKVDFDRDIRPILSENCFTCHGPDPKARKAGLRLDLSDEAEAELESGSRAIVPGKPDESELVFRVEEADPTLHMPPPDSGKSISPEQAALLRRWVEEGAEYAQHWAFVKPARPQPPSVRQESWVRNPIDRFILSRLEREELVPSPEADRATLIRRVSLDLTGLPPSAEEVEAFLGDLRPDAYERLVDRLLASPHYGERWARPWLDMARYADSNGYSIDAPRSIWKYRDWVIDSLNRDQPFDEFATDQLAGDLRRDSTLDQRVATGFHRNTPINQEGGIDKEQFRVESILDRTNTTATVFLGLTMGCCQCHSHKYDPLSQEEYYRFFAFFNNSDEPEIPVATPEEVAKRDEVLARVDEYLKRLWEDEPGLREQQRAWEQGLDMEGRQKQSQEVREAFDTPFEKRDPEKNRVVFAAFIDQAPSAKDHKKGLDAIRAEMPKITTTMVVRERAKDRRTTHVLTQGEFTRPAAEVSPGVPAVLSPLEAESEPPDRLDLARWLFAPDHALTSRVTVNRFWQAHFGRGLVETENDFGTQGARPTHPELLDWLASEFIRLGWSQKALHRLIVTSATYRQSSGARPDAAAKDPGNRLLARQSRLRLEAEPIRDAALAASGLLARQVGGPSVFPPQPDGVMSLGQMRREWKADTGSGRYRRGLYTFFWRATPHPMLTVFDAPDATRACTRRERSNTPLQALTLLNDEAYFECAEALADRVLREGPSDDPGRLDLLFRLTLARIPSDSESQRLAGLLAQLRAEPGATDREAWTTAARVLLNLDEFITRE
jgi:hypothetical protein